MQLNESTGMSRRDEDRAAHFEFIALALFGFVALAYVIVLVRGAPVDGAAPAATSLISTEIE